MRARAYAPSHSATHVLRTCVVCVAQLFVLCKFNFCNSHQFRESPIELPFCVVTQDLQKSCVFDILLTLACNFIRNLGRVWNPWPNQALNLTFPFALWLRKLSKPLIIYCHYSSPPLPPTMTQQPPVNLSPSFLEELSIKILFFKFYSTIMKVQ